MILNGDIPVGLVEELYYRLEDNGIYVEDFIVDTNEGHINIITNVPFNEGNIWEAIYNDHIWNEINYYIEDVVDRGFLEEARILLKNETGAVSPAVVVAITSGSVAATNAANNLATNSTSLSDATITLGPLASAGVIVGLIAFAVGAFIWMTRSHY